MKDRIKAVRLALGLSQDDFARKIGYETRGAITNIESGKTKPKPQFINRLVETMHVNRSWLETGEGDMFRELDADQQLAEAVNALLDSPEDDLRRLWVSRVAQMTMEEVELMSDFLRSLLPE